MNTYENISNNRTLVTLATASFVVRVTLILACNDSLARMFSSLIL